MYERNFEIESHKVGWGGEGQGGKGQKAKQVLLCGRSRQKEGGGRRGVPQQNASRASGGGPWRAALFKTAGALGATITLRWWSK